MLEQYERQLKARAAWTREWESKVQVFFTEEWAKGWMREAGLLSSTQTFTGIRSMLLRDVPPESEDPSRWEARIERSAKRQIQALIDARRGGMMKVLSRRSGSSPDSDR